MHWFLLAAAIKFHGLGGLNNGNLFSHTSRVYKFLIKVPQGQKSHLAGLYSCGLTWPFLVNGERERVRETLLIKPLILSIRATHFMIWFNCVCMHAQLLSCVRLCNRIACSPPDSFVYGIVQARILEWVAIFSSRRSSQPEGSNPCLLRLLHLQVDSSPLRSP